MSRVTTALVDNSVFSHAKIEAVTADPEAPPHRFNRTNQLAVFKIRDEYGDDHRWLNREVNAIPTLRRMAVEGHVKLYFYNELFLESAKAYDRASLLDGVGFGEILSPIERSRFFQKDRFEDYTNKNSLREFVRFLVTLSENDVNKLLRKRDITDADRVALREVDILKDICRGMSFEHYDDAFHFWAAEHADLDFYITFDNRFRNSLSKQKIKTKASTVSVIEFLSEIGVKFFDQMPVDFGATYDFSGRKV